eukprot:s1297_g4.t1
MQTAQLRRTIASDAMPTVPIVYFAIATGLVWLMFLVMAAIRACTGDYNTPPPEAHLHATAATAPQRSEAEKVAMLATIDAGCCTEQTSIGMTMPSSVPCADTGNCWQSFPG